MAASDSTPGDVFDGNNGWVTGGADYFDTKPRAGFYASMAINLSTGCRPLFDVGEVLRLRALARRPVFKGFFYGERG
jgi:hypothetical protein